MSTHTPTKRKQKKKQQIQQVVSSFLLLWGPFKTTPKKKTRYPENTHTIEIVRFGTKCSAGPARGGGMELSPRSKQEPGQGNLLVRDGHRNLQFVNDPDGPYSSSEAPPEKHLMTQRKLTLRFSQIGGGACRVPNFSGTSCLLSNQPFWKQVGDSSAKSTYMVPPSSTLQRVRMRKMPSLSPLRHS